MAVPAVKIVRPRGEPGAAAGGNSARRGRLDSIQLLHFHLGSQMANIRDIATGVRESARLR
ncbi:hypothetical protein ACP3P6_20560 [Enterobacter mori]